MVKGNGFSQVAASFSGWTEPDRDATALSELVGLTGGHTRVVVLPKEGRNHGDTS